MPHSLYGVIPALITPRTADADEPDLEQLETLSKWLIGQGVHGLFPCSSTGEAPLLSWKQRQMVVETVVEAANGMVPVLAGAGAASTAESLRLARDASQAGATHLAVLPLHFVPLSQEELYGYFAAIVDHVNLPTLLYNYPGRTGGQNIAPETAARLARDHNVLGIKDSSGDITNALGYLDACGPEFAVFTGFESLVYSLLTIGGAGTICAGANVLPRRLVELYEAAQRGDHAAAQNMQRQLLPWRQLVKLGTFPAAVKAAMTLIGQPVGDPFLPAHPVNGEQEQVIKHLLEKLTMP